MDIVLKSQVGELRCENKMYFTMMLAVAEMEREMIIERTQNGKNFAKENDPNFRDGRPKKI